MDGWKEVLIFNIEITGSEKVSGRTGEGEMICFTGDADCPEFKGKVLPGGVDTQKEQKGGRRTLSARYILEGTDREGKPCRIFVENNGILDENRQLEYTVPLIYTDSEALSYLETAKLRGTITPFGTMGIQIHIFCEQEEAL